MSREKLNVVVEAVRLLNEGFTYQTDTRMQGYPDDPELIVDGGRWEEAYKIADALGLTVSIVSHNCIRIF